MKVLTVVVLLLIAAPLFGAYQYYYTDNFATWNGNAWRPFGFVYTGPTGFYTVPNQNYLFWYGTIQSRLAVPDGTSDYEVNATIHYGPGFWTHTTHTIYLRSGNFSNSSTAYYAVRLSYYPQFRIQLLKSNPGCCVQLASTTATPHDNMVVRAVIRGSEILVSLDGNRLFRVTDSSLLSGPPALGGYGVPYSSAIASVSLGVIDRVAPNPVDLNTVNISAFLNSIHLQWAAASDDPNGVGVGSYLIYRNGQLYDTTTATSFIDEAVSPGTTYTYTVYAEDLHGNQSSPTTFNVTTPESGPPPVEEGDGRRMGVRSTGSYWGAGGEQIDTLSGNLNYSIPLLQAMGRNDWAVSFALSYNSQLWRKDSGGTWKLGRDLGYGYGWRLQAGSLTPFWSGEVIDHYTYIDSTGAAYRLDVNTNGVWSSREAIYLSYDSNSNRLYFPDGSFWVMGSISASAEEDAGSRYPTLMQDSNGNQILVRYCPGIGQSQENTSARIKEIEDVRATQSSSPPNNFRTYEFLYNTDPIPHLTEIRFYMGTQQRYTFSYLSDQVLYTPFSPPVAMWTVSLLQRIDLPGVGLDYQISYGSNGSGELAQVDLLHGAHLRWAYRDFTFSDGRTLREVQYRWLSKASGAAETQYSFARDESDSGRTMHTAMYLNDPSGLSQKAWFFLSAGDWKDGLVLRYEERPSPGQTATRKQEFTWTRDTLLNPYVASVVTTLDPTTAYEKVSKTEQELDTHGNVKETRIFNYGDLSTPYRTYHHSYQHEVNYYGALYAARHIYNRLTTTTLSGGGQQVTLVSNTYDGGTPINRTGLRNHDTANYGTGQTIRGNVSSRVAGGVTANFYYDITGTVYSSNDGQGHSVAITLASGLNNTVPGVITPNGESNLATTLSWTSFLALDTDTQPNNNWSQTTYDSAGRPATRQSYDGAISTYAYSNSPPTVTATTGSQWTRTTMDGLGRTVKVETGYNSTTVSIVDTEYDICACSPLGKVKRVSRPYAPGGTVYWTTYAYDCLGRTVSVTQPGNSGATTYVYEGNTVKVTDPAGHWKKYTLDVLGNLVKVTEPDPALGNVDTNYTYNLRNQLTGVSMPRGGTTQTRTFNYDLTTGRLSSATNPESGSTSYTYNADGTLASRTDAKNQQVQYSYDSFQRVTQIRRYNSSGQEQTCERVNFTYDSGTNGWGRLTGSAWGGTGCTGGSWSQSFEYNTAGRVTRKTQVGGNYNLQANFTYNTLGQLVSTQYPNSGPTFTYSFDSMARPIKLTSSGVDWVKDVVYNTAGQITSMKYTGDGGAENYISETNEYNILGQMTRRRTQENYNFWAVQQDRTYTFSSTNNDGRITQMADAVSGETVVYQYDSLKRLISAETTGPQWGQSFGYDAFGNLLNQTVTKGSAPSMSVSVNPANNRINGYSYDSNGNLTAMTNLTMTYDIENRLVEAVHGVNGTERYVYDPSGQRVWKQEPSRTMVYFYSVDGTLLATYGDGSNTDYNVYFAGKQIWAETAWGSPTLWAGPVALDRLGSVVHRYGSASRYFPYGDEPATTTQDRAKFATYYRDSTSTLDYARNRYYSRAIARFTTPDPFGGSARPANPQSWNRYSYVGNDPVNFSDPGGLDYGVVTTPPVNVTASALPAGYDWAWGGYGLWFGYGDPCAADGYGGILSAFMCYGMPNYDWGGMSSGGGGGGGLAVSHKGGWYTTPSTTGPTAWQYLTSNWSNCLNYFASAPGFDTSRLQALLSTGITWVDTRYSAGDEMVTIAGNSMTMRDFVGDAEARVVPGTNIVALGVNYYSDLTQTQQIAVAIHEALHMMIPGGDSGLAYWLGNFGFDPLSIKDGGSHRITQWIVGTANQMDTNGGCQRVNISINQ